MFSKILVANRGEIACRIIRTAQRLGVRTVAVYSEVDVHALHVRLADEALCIGQAAPQASYLQIDRIVQAALDSGAEAVHPGYGFLSERADFCAACEQAGLVFVGPSAFAINAMGSKSQAKALMVQAGVPVVPGYHGDDQIRSCLKLEADAIGYPVLIKAVMGGGGKGMRVVASSDLFEDALLSCQREALSSFGDDRVLLEKYVARPRHIEVQVFADRHGSVVHLFDRDCSVQRRHQKVLEEAPAPNWPEAQRQAMCQAAVQAAKAVGYVGAGTVEFLVEPNGVFYFMEMNTRLQVEHPVTEMITGLDLVEWQLRVAAGEPLPLRQEDIHMSGHALEVRVYAEDPARDFLPSIGPLLYVNMPTENSYTRVDAGVQAGDAISPYYDPMIAKLIVWGEHRELSRRRMQQVLRTCHVVGVATNVAFLDRLMGCSSFVSSVLDTGLIERERAVLLPQRQMPSLAVLSLLLISRVQQHRANSNGSIWQTGAGWRLNADPVMMFSVIHDGGEQFVTLSVQGQTHMIRIQDTTYPVTLVGQEGDCWRVRQGAQVFRGWVINHGQYAHVFHEGEVWRLVLKAPFLSEGEGGVDRASLKAPMPGKVLSLRAKAGMVQAGQPLLVLEAMKMEHTIVAPCAGLLKGFHVAEGDWVSDGAELMDFEPDSS